MCFVITTDRDNPVFEVSHVTCGTGNAHHVIALQDGNDELETFRVIIF
jgi:hypothetical protein